MEKPYLTIVIPVYNVEAYIKRCLDSIVVLNIPCYEIIVVNDGTKDNSMDIVNEYAGRYDNIKVINQDNMGLGAARNTGLKAATGDYVYFLDSDDYVDPALFTQLISERNSLYDVIIGDYYIEEKGNITYGPYHINDNGRIEMNGTAFFCKYYRKYINTSVWRYVYRRDFLKKSNFLFTEGIYHEDVNWSPKVLIGAQNVLYVPIPFYFYQIRQGSIINSALSKKKLDDLMYAYNDILSLKVGASPEVQKELGYITVVGVLYVYGLYREIINTDDVYTKMMPIFQDKGTHYWYINVIRKIMLVSPIFWGKFLQWKYGRKQ